MTMTTYRLVRLLDIIVALLVVAGVITVIKLEVLGTALAVTLGALALIVLYTLLPGLRRIALASLARGQCPQCTGPVRHDPGVRVEHYCPSCQVGFTSRGRRVAGSDDHE